MKTALIEKKDKVKGVIKVPPSKSITNRALILASLANGKSVLKNVLFSDDTKHMISALKKLGVKIQKNKDSLIVFGTNGKFKTPKTPLFLGNSGTSFRFLTAISCLVPGKTQLLGDSRMKERPIKELTDSLKSLGVKIDFLEKKNYPPIEVSYFDFEGGIISINGEVSSQFISALLFLSPFSKSKDTVIKIEGELVSKPYIDMSISLLRNFGVKVENKSYKEIRIKANQELRPITLEIEGDASSASYFFGIAALTNGDIEVKSIGINSIQGDINFIKILEQMGCKIYKKSNSIRLKGPTKLNSPEEVDLSDMPDVALTLAVLCAVSEGKTLITGLKTLKLKECDRLKALDTELKKLGVKVKTTKDSIEIFGSKLNSAEIETYNDHRIAMSFSLLALKESNIKILDPDCVKKTYPNFFKGLRKLKIKVKIHA